MNQQEPEDGPEQEEEQDRKYVGFLWGVVIVILGVTAIFLWFRYGP